MISRPYPFPSSLFPSFDPSSSLNGTDCATIRTITNVTSYVDISPISALPSSAFTLKLMATSLSNRTLSGSMNFTLTATSTTESLRGGYALGSSDNGNVGTVWLDRSGMKGYSSARFTTHFSHSYPQDPNRSNVEVLVVVDRGIIEIFLDGGIGASGTAVWFQSQETASGGGIDLLQLSSRIEGDGDVQTEMQELKSL